MPPSSELNQPGAIPQFKGLNCGIVPGWFSSAKGGMSPKMCLPSNHSIHGQMALHMAGVVFDLLAHFHGWEYVFVY